MCGVFLFAAVVQYNDPDPLMWIGIYATAAALSLMAAFGRFAPRSTLVAFLVFAAGSLYSLPAVLRSSLSAYTSFHMQSPQDEVARESVGLVICTVWAGYLYWYGKHTRQAGNGQS